MAPPLSLNSFKPPPVPPSPPSPCASRREAQLIRPVCAADLGGLVACGGPGGTVARSWRWGVGGRSGLGNLSRRSYFLALDLPSFVGFSWVNQPMNLLDETLGRSSLLTPNPESTEGGCQVSLLKRQKMLL